jgi:hypothetical protein
VVEHPGVRVGDQGALALVLTVDRSKPTDFGDQYYLGSEKPADSGGGSTWSFRSSGKSFAMASPRDSKCF